MAPGAADAIGSFGGMDRARPGERHSRAGSPDARASMPASHARTHAGSANLAGRAVVQASGADDAVILELARTQGQVVTRRQLLDLGIGRGAIEHRIRVGRLHRLHRGVFADGRPDVPPLGRAVAAALACGPAAAISHDTAAAIWRIGGTSRPPVHITVRVGQPRSRPGIEVHRSPGLAPDDVAPHGGAAVTTPARTIEDLASKLDTGQLLRVVEAAVAQRIVTLGGLAAREKDRPRRAGRQRLRQVLDAFAEPPITHSEAERLLADLLADAGLRPDDMNTAVGGYLVDAVWRRERFAIEVDGFATHGTRVAFEEDRLRDATLLAGGCRVMRVTWRQIVHDRLGVAVRIAQALAHARERRE